MDQNSNTDISVINVQDTNTLATESNDNTNNYYSHLVNVTKTGLAGLASYIGAEFSVMRYASKLCYYRADHSLVVTYLFACAAKSISGFACSNYSIELLTNIHQIVFRRTTYLLKLALGILAAMILALLSKCSVKYLHMVISDEMAFSLHQAFLQNCRDMHYDEFLEKSKTFDITNSIKAYWQGNDLSATSLTLLGKSTNVFCLLIYFILSIIKILTLNPSKTKYLQVRSRVKYGFYGILLILAIGKCFGYFTRDFYKRMYQEYQTLQVTGDRYGTLCMEELNRLKLIKQMSTSFCQVLERRHKDQIYDVLYRSYYPHQIIGHALLYISGQYQHLAIVLAIICYHIFFGHLGVITLLSKIVRSAASLMMSYQDIMHYLRLMLYITTATSQDKYLIKELNGALHYITINRKKYSTVLSEEDQFTHKEPRKYLSLPLDMSINSSYMFEIKADQYYQNNLNITLEKGTVSYLVGKTGTGKTSIIDYITGVRQKGQSYLKFNQKLYPVSLSSKLCAKNVIVMNQQADFFPATIRENLVLDNTISDGDLKQLLVDFHLDELIPRLDTIIAFSAGNISGGQRQRLSAVRAIVAHKSRNRNTALLLADEPFSACGYKLGAQLLALLKSQFRDSKILIITHQTKYINDNQKIYHIQRSDNDKVLTTVHTLKSFNERK